jgi:serine/threonine protein kinase
MERRMGDVAYCIEDGEHVVYKILTSRLSGTPLLVRRFWREVMTAAFLGSQIVGVPRVLWCGTDPRPWYVQRCAGQNSLAKWISTNSYPLDASGRQKAKTLLNRIATILSKVHVLGVIHRDLTPDNIILDRQGRPHIIDWGLCAWAGEYPSMLFVSGRENEYANATERLTEIGRRHGTRGYCAPEQYDAHMDLPAQKNDLYSLAVIASEAITGISPFNHGPEKLTHQDVLAALPTRQLNVFSADHINPLVSETMGDTFWKFLISESSARNKSWSALLNHVSHACG